MSTGSLSSCTDDELVEMIRAGGATREAAWSDMLRRHTPKMYGVARSFDIDQATAEDLVQTAWLRFLERSDQLRDTVLGRPVALHDRAQRGPSLGDSTAHGAGCRRLGDPPGRHACARRGTDRNRTGRGVAQRVCSVGRRLPAVAEPDAGRPPAVVRRDRRRPRPPSRLTRPESSAVPRTSATPASTRTRDRGMSVTVPHVSDFHVSAGAVGDHARRSTPTPTTTPTQGGGK